MLIESARIGDCLFRLVEKPSALGGEFFASRYYFTGSNLDHPWLTVIAFLGQDRAHALRQFERRRDNQLAAIEAAGHG